VKDGNGDVASYNHTGRYSFNEKGICILSGQYVRKDLQVYKREKEEPDFHLGDVSLQRFLTFGTFSYEYISPLNPK